MSGCMQNPPLKGILTYSGTPGFDQAFTLVNNPFPMETAESDQDAPVAPLRRVAVVTDSASAIPPEMAAEFGIAIAPMEITIDGRTYVEGPSVSLKTFYRDLVTADKLPTTSAPKPQAWLNAIGEAAKSAGSVLCVTLSSNLSAAYDAARVAKDLAQKGSFRHERQGVRLRKRGRFTGPHRTRGGARRGSAATRSTTWNPPPRTSGRVSTSWRSLKR